MYTIEVFDGGQHPAPEPYSTARAGTEREARRVAARMLGHSTLRGASTWEQMRGGTAFRFGPWEEGDNGYDVVVITIDDED